MTSANTDVVSALGRTFLLRPSEHDAFVYQTWLRSYRQQYRNVQPHDEWMSAQRAIIRDLMPLVRCAVLPEAPRAIHGWVCGRPGVLHYVYVPAPLRRKGFASALVAAVCGTSGGVHSHTWPTERGLDLRNAFKKKWRYDPHAIVNEVRLMYTAEARAS